MHDFSIAKRYIIYVAGLFLLSLGVVLIVRSALGTTPISSINYVVSINTPLSLGTCTFAINMLLILGQFLILGHRCTRVDAVEILLQIPFSFIFSAFIDANMYLTRSFVPQNYLISFAALALGCLTQALGVTLELKPNVSKMSAEAFVAYAAERFNKPFGRLKVIFDLSLVSTAIVVSLCFSGRIEGVREGSLIAAASTGALVTLLSRHIITRRNASAAAHALRHILPHT